MNNNEDNITNSPADSSTNENVADTKYAYAAGEQLICNMRHYAALSEYEVSIWGGSDMYSSSPINLGSSVGAQNIDFAREWAAKHKLLFKQGYLYLQRLLFIKRAL